MKNVKIISGTYGYNDGKHIIPKDSRSGSFALEDKEAERLVNLEVAEYADALKKPEDFKDIPDENEDIPNEGEEDFGKTDLSYTADSTVSELRKVGKAVGIAFTVGTTKKDMLAALDAYFGQSDAEAPAPDISVEEPVE